MSQDRSRGKSFLQGKEGFLGRGVKIERSTFSEESGQRSCNLGILEDKAVV